MSIICQNEAATKVLLIGLLLIVFTGCGQTRYRNYVHPSYGQAEFDRDRYECERENTYVDQSGYQTGVRVPYYAGSYGQYQSSLEVDYPRAQACMNARGWREVEEKIRSEPSSGSYSGSSKPSLRPGAMYDLGVKYANGQGMLQDDVRAYMWYTLAASNLTGIQQRWAADGRDYVASRMLPEQIAEAQRLAQQCQASNYKNCD